MPMLMAGTVTLFGMAATGKLLTSTAGFCPLKD
jgi:hypothetical protein